MIAAGLYFGLRDRGALQASVAPLEMATRPTAGTILTALPSPIVITPAPAPERSVVAAAGARALAAHRDLLLTTCWAPSAAKTKDPPQVKLTLNVAFGPDGKQLARGISETRGALRADVTACVQRELPPLEIDPLGVQVETEIPLTLP